MNKRNIQRRKEPGFILEPCLVDKKGSGYFTKAANKCLL